jgi:hypothetical protein
MFVDQIQDGRQEAEKQEISIRSYVYNYFISLCAIAGAC